MYLSSKPNRLTTTAKTRLHSHKLDNIEPRKRSPDGNSQGPPSPSEVIVFNNTNHASNGGRNNQSTRSAPEAPIVPQAEEIHRYFRESWERRMHEITTQKKTVLWIQSDRDESRDGSHSSGALSHQSVQNKGKNSPQHTQRK